MHAHDLSLSLALPPSLLPAPSYLLRSHHFPMLDIPGFIHPISVHSLDDLPSLMGRLVPSLSPRALSHAPTRSHPNAPYFHHCPMLAIPGFIHPVSIHSLNDVPSLMARHMPSVPRKVLHIKYSCADEDELRAELAATIMSMQGGWIDHVLPARV
ncbi:unnamed protein product [Closterium sp. NIES-65]|nr:unnamed protein product [Closterium sp. NIES-65]